MNTYLLNVAVACYANDNDAFIPELWAMEGLAILEENQVMAALVHKDFSPNVANFGDIVNTRRPGTFKAYRKVDGDAVTAQDATATNVQVPLNQHYYVSFAINDGEASKSFKDLVEVYLRPGMLGIARGIDRMLAGQVHRFLGNAVGKLNGVTGSTSKDYLLELREEMNRNLAYPADRRLVLAPAAETLLLKTDMFIKANERGDGGMALEDARLGRVLGFDTFMDQNQPSLSSGGDTAAGTVNNAGGYPAGHAASMTVAIAGYEVQVGEYVVLTENGQPTYATAVTANVNTTAVTLNEALKYAVTNASAITAYKKCDAKGAYAAGYAKGIIVDGWTAAAAPQVGQLVGIGAPGANRRTYTIIESYVNPSSAAEQIIWLDRPLELQVADNEDIFPGPYGSFNFAFHRDALAFVSRPLALPNAAFGVRAGVADYNNVGMRVSMQYDINYQATKVNLDMLAGVALLDVNLGAVLLT